MKSKKLPVLMILVFGVTGFAQPAAAPLLSRTGLWQVGPIPGLKHRFELKKGGLKSHTVLNARIQRLKLNGHLDVSKGSAATNTNLQSSGFAAVDTKGAMGRALKWSLKGLYSRTRKKGESLKWSLLLSSRFGKTHTSNNLSYRSTTGGSHLLNGKWTLFRSLFRGHLDGSLDYRFDHGVLMEKASARLKGKLSRRGQFRLQLTRQLYANQTTRLDLSLAPGKGRSATTLKINVNDRGAGRLGLKLTF